MEHPNGCSAGLPSPLVARNRLCQFILLYYKRQRHLDTLLFSACSTTAASSHATRSAIVLGSPDTVRSRRAMKKFAQLGITYPAKRT
eukprot:4681639-Pyramimonas_sp.AAC.1